LGTRSSPLARWQAQFVADCLAALGHAVELVPVTTAGDVTTGPLREAGGQGFFTKELQRALLDGRIDLAVHSLKDLPTDAVPGLALAAVPERENPADVLVCAPSIGASDLQSLPRGARVATGSTRRRAQLLNARPDLVMCDVRGNVETRLRKLDEGQFDAIVLALAGLTRLGLVKRATQILPPEVMLPAVGQGALGIETRADDDATLAMLAPLNEPNSRQCVLAERAMLAELRGGCLAPVGAWGRIEAAQLRLDGVVLSVDGRQRLMASAVGASTDAEKIGKDVARELIDQGAAQLIAAART
jgi:hydroxymethylbilane synthase